MKTADLQGAALDWAVALIEFPAPDYEDNDRFVYVQGDDEFHYSPSTNWSLGGPIIEREGITLLSHDVDLWEASYNPHTKVFNGATSLIAAMRCYVASKLGEDVEIPTELMEALR